MKPIIISTGIASKEEIQDVIDICRKEGNDKIILLKCTSSYPASISDANLSMIPKLKEDFNTQVGFSDHTLGITAPIIAVSLGAKVIEKHFIIDKSIGGHDCEFSLDKQEFETMIKEVRKTENFLGKVDYSLNEQKIKSRRFSRSLYVSKDIKKGEPFTHKNVKSVRPGFGLHPKYLNILLEKVAQKDYSFAERLSEEMIL